MTSDPRKPSGLSDGNGVFILETVLACFFIVAVAAIGIFAILIGA